MAKDRLYEYLKRTPENSNVSVVKAIAQASGSLDDYLTKEEAEATYTKKTEVEEVVQEKVDAAIEDLDIEKYIDEEEIAEKLEELALEDYAKTADVEENYLSKEDSYNIERVVWFEGAATHVQTSKYRILPEFRLMEGACIGTLSGDKIVSMGILHDGVIQNAQLYYNDEFHHVMLTEVESGGNYYYEFDAVETGGTYPEELELRPIYAFVDANGGEAITASEKFYAAVASLVGGVLIDHDEKIDEAYNKSSRIWDNNLDGSAIGGRLNDDEDKLDNLQEVVIDGTDEKRSIIDRLDHFIEADAGSIEEEVQNMADQISGAFDDVNQSLTTVSQWLLHITNEDLPKIDTKLAKTDSYDLRFDQWFQGETEVSPQSQEADPYANPVWEYKFWPAFRPALNGFILDNKSNNLLQVSDDEQRSFKLYFTVRGIELVAECYNSEGPDNVGYSASVDWSSVANHSWWLEKLDLDLSALVSSIDEHGAHCDVSNTFKGAVLQVVNEESPEIRGDYLKKADAYDIDKHLFISGSAMLESDDRYTIAPLIDPVPGMMLVADEFGEIIRVDQDKNIPDAELYYDGRMHTIPLYYDEDNYNYWFNAKDISEFPQELELGDVYVYLSSKGEFDYNKMFSDKYFASMAYLIADPIIELQKSIQELSEGMSQWIYGFNTQMQDVKERVAALERKVLVEYRIYADGNGTDSEFLLYAGDMTQNIAMQHIFINGVLDKDSTLAYHDGYTYVQIRQENPRFSGNYEPVILDAGDLVTIEFYKWEN